MLYNLLVLVCFSIVIRSKTFNMKRVCLWELQKGEKLEVSHSTLGNYKRTPKNKVGVGATLETSPN